MYLEHYSLSFYIYMNKEILFPFKKKEHKRKGSIQKEAGNSALLQTVSYLSFLPLKIILIASSKEAIGHG